MNSPRVIVDGQDDQCRQPIGIARVSHVAQCEEISTTTAHPLGTLTAVEHAAAIVRARAAVARYEALWESDGCMAAKGDRDRAKRLLDLLLAWPGGAA